MVKPKYSTEQLLDKQIKKEENRLAMIRELERILNLSVIKNEFVPNYIVDLQALVDEAKTFNKEALNGA